MNNYIAEIQNKLRSLIEREKRKTGFEKLFLFILALVMAFLLIVLLETIGNFSPLVRTILFFFYLIFVIGGGLIYIALPFIKDFRYYSHPDYILAAKTVGNHFPEIKDELANVLQLISENNAGYSSSLIEASFNSIYSRCAKLDFNRIVNFEKTKRLFKISLASLLSVIILILFIPGLNSSAYRLFNYSKNFTPPPKFIFNVSPGNIEVTKGESVSIKIRVLGKQPGEIILSSRLDEQSEFVEKKLLPDSLGIFSYDAIFLKSSLQYFVSAEGIESNLFKISVVNRPIISSLDVNIIPPAYSGMPATDLKDNGNITALPGSKIKISIQASRELASSCIMFSDTTEKQMQVNNNFASASFIASKEIDYHILIQDKQKFENANPITYSIKLLTDAAPTIEMISPNEDVKLGTQNKISLVSKIGDDYGFSKMILNYRLSASKYRDSESKYSQLSLPFSKGKKEEEIYYRWDLSPLYLAEGESVNYYLEIFDNDNVKGPKSARTKEFLVQVPALDQLFKEAESTQKEATQDLAETLKDAEKLQQELKKISEDLKQNKKEISWQEKERIEKAVEKFEKLGEKLDDVSQKLSEMKNDLMKNNLLSKETLDKYNELQEMMDQFNSDDLKDAFKKMQDTLKGLMRENAQMSMEDLKANEEMLKSSIERTLNLLKRIQIEQKIDELVKRAQDISQKLDDLKNKTQNKNLNDKNSRDELSQRQKDVSDNLDQLDKEMDNLSDKMKDMKDMPKEMMNKIKQEFDKQKNEQLSEEAKKSLQQMQKQNAMQNQQKLSSNMKEMMQQFEQLQNQMQQMNQTKAFYDMAKILNDLITLSKEQEQLRNKTTRLSYQSPELNKAAREQNELQSSLNKVLQNMNALSQKTFAITPEMGNALGKAFGEMQQSQNALQNQNARLAENKQTGSMQYLNEAASMMKNSMNQMMNGGSGSGMMGLMQQLQQMAQQQMNLNQLTQAMKNGQMTQSMMAQMQRLAQQQDMIRKSLEELNSEAKESGQSKKLASNLDKVLDEMKEVVTNLRSEKIDDNLVKQQEKILSKLLDAQRSMSERDYEKDRKSNTGQNTSRTSPPELFLKSEAGKNKLRDELQKAIREGYKKDYEELIRKYFESLQNQKKD